MIFTPIYAKSPVLAYNFSEAKAHTIYAEASGHIGVMPKSETTKLLVEQAVAQLRATSTALAALKHESLFGVIGTHRLIFAIKPLAGRRFILRCKAAWCGAAFFTHLKLLIFTLDKT